VAANPLPALLEQIDELLASPFREEEPTTLARLERRMSELAGALNEGNKEQKAEELVRVSRRITSAHADIERLRCSLSELRARAPAARTAV
jgi:hypothetical protein